MVDLDFSKYKRRRKGKFQEMVGRTAEETIKRAAEYEAEIAENKEVWFMMVIRGRSRPYWVVI